MKYSDAKKLFDVMSDEMTRLGGLLYGLKKNGVLVDSMSLNGQLVISRIAKMMIDGRLDSFGKAYLALMKSDAHLHFSRYLAESARMEKHLDEMDFMNTKECVKDWIRLSIEDDNKMFDLDEFERELGEIK